MVLALGDTSRAMLEARFMVKTFVVTCGGAAESVTCTVNVTGPAGPVGVPVMAPPVLIESPAGSDPLDTVHV